jgi:RNA polymerase sigma-B factor
LLNHQRLVTPIANHYAHLSPEPLEDLIQVGLIGLLRAAEGYDATAKIPFDSYARPHIRGAILHHLRDRAWLVRLPRRQAERQWSQRQILSDQPNERMSATEQALARWRAMNRPMSLETLPTEPATDPTERGNAMVTGLAVSTPEGEGPYVPNGLAQAWQQCSVDEMLAMVGPRQRRVLRHVVLDGWSYRRTANALKVSAPTVQRLLHRALAQLQGQLSCDRAPSAAQGC